MKKKRYVFALIFTIFMVFSAEYLNQLEIIFPEILALLSGAWIAENQPWKVNKVQLFLLMSISSFVGVILVKYLSLHILIKISIAFTFSYIMLRLTKTTIIPLISACILPILLNTSTWVYPISVTIMCALIVIFQYIMEIHGIRNTEKYPKEDTLLDNLVTVDMEDVSEQYTLKKYFKILLIILLVSFIPVKTNNLYFIAPPLIVTFMEFSDPSSPARKNVKKVIFILIVASFIGTTLRIFLDVYLQFPLWLVAGITTICIFTVFEKTSIIFPPAGAIALLPLLLNTDGLYLYPIQVFIGSCIFIFFALFIFRNDEIDEINDYELNN